MKPFPFHSPYISYESGIYKIQTWRAAPMANFSVPALELEELT